MSSRTEDEIFSGAGRLISALTSGSLTHAVFLQGDQLLCGYIFKEACARVCGVDISRLENAPGIITYAGESLQVKHIEELLEELQNPPVTPRRMIYIRNAGLISEIVQNKLLKTFEEPLPNNQFVLSGNNGQLLPTLYSRCMSIRLPDVFAEDRAKAADCLALLSESDVTGEDAALLLELTGGDLDEAEALSANAALAKLCADAFDFACVPSMRTIFDAPPAFSATREDAGRVMDVFIRCFSDMLRCAEGVEPFVFITSDRRAAIQKRARALSEDALLVALDGCFEARDRLRRNMPARQTMDNFFANAKVFRPAV